MANVDLSTNNGYEMTFHWLLQVTDCITCVEDGQKTSQRTCTKKHSLLMFRNQSYVQIVQRQRNVLNTIFKKELHWQY